MSKGYALVSVMFICSIIFMLGMSVLNSSTTEILLGSYMRDYTLAYYIAEGGIHKALADIKQSPNFDYETHWKSLGKGQYRLAVRSLENDLVEITSESKMGKAKVLIRVTAKIFVEVNEDVNTEDSRCVHVKVISWKLDGPI